MNSNSPENRSRLPLKTLIPLGIVVVAALNYSHYIRDAFNVVFNPSQTKKEAESDKKFVEEFKKEFQEIESVMNSPTEER